MAWRPLEKKYAPTLANAMFALVPYLLITSASEFYREQIARDLHGSLGALAVIGGLSTAGYAFGALFGGDLVNRLVQRRLFLAATVLLALGWSLGAAAGGIAMFGAGRVLAGFATGILLVTALPPVIRNFPSSRLPVTVCFINVAFFGAIAAGPLLGGIVASSHVWRIVYAGFTALTVFNLGLAIITLPETKPPNPGLPFDRTGIGLAFLATALPFWASGELTAHGFGAPVVAVPLGIGLVAFVAMLLTEYHKSEPLSPVKRMWTTLPVTGTLIAMVGGGAFVSFIVLMTQYLLKAAHRPPLAAGAAFWPLVAGTLVTAVLLGVLFRTRFLPLLAFGGMLLLIAGGVLFAFYLPNSGNAIFLAATGILGLGAGATVTPGLYLAAFSLQIAIIARLFALIELVRSVADFILAPVVVKIAELSSSAMLSASGVRSALWIAVAIAAAGTVLVIALYVLGGTRLIPPAIEAWTAEGKTALHSPPLLAVLRKRRSK